jgi:hypothetical protein
MPHVAVRKILVIVAAIVVFLWTVVSGLAEARGADHVVRVQVDSATVVTRIPEDFLGFGYETSAVAQLGFFSAKNARMINLYKNLGPHGLIRIGGNVSDHTRFVPEGTAAAKTEREVTVINRANLSDLGDFARATGWRVMWGLNLGTGTKEEAVEEAVAVDRALGGMLQSFEIGNEVDLMRRYAKDYDAYHAAYAEYKAAIRARLPDAVFSGPDAAGNLAFVERFVATQSADMKLITHHYYHSGARNAKATMEYLLARDGAFDARLDRLRTLADDHHLAYRINELNSFSGGGKPGVSDTLGAALWCLDYMFDVAAHGGAGVNMETDINQLGFISFYSPIVHDPAGACSARPEYYAMLAFAMAGRSELLKVRVEKDEINLTAYATRSKDGSIDLTVINKDISRDATIECAVPPGCKDVEAYRLNGPSVDAKTGVSFAGSAVADEGTWEPGKPQSAPVADGVARLSVPHASAAVLRCRRQSSVPTSHASTVRQTLEADFGAGELRVLKADGPEFALPPSYFSFASEHADVAMSIIRQRLTSQSPVIRANGYDFLGRLIVVPAHREEVIEVLKDAEKHEVFQIREFVTHFLR